MILLLCVFFLSFCANVGGRNSETLYLENYPFCWDADWLGAVLTVSIFAKTFFSVLALTLLRKLKVVPDDFQIIAVCIVLSLASHVIYAFSTLV